MLLNILGLHLDSKMTWKVHIKKGNDMDIKMKKMYWFFGKKLSLSLESYSFTPLKGDHKTNLDLRCRVMGLL